jgi:hypothetical protein
LVTTPYPWPLLRTCIDHLLSHRAILPMTDRERCPATSGGDEQTGAVSSAPGGDSPASGGVVRLLNTADGRVLCLAGDVGSAVVDSFLRRYGREPARIDGIDAGSVTALSTPALDLVVDHLDAARRAGRPVALRLSAGVERLLDAHPDLAGEPWGTGR